MRARRSSAVAIATALISPEGFGYSCAIYLSIKLFHGPKVPKPDPLVTATNLIYSGFNVIDMAQVQQNQG